MYSCSCSPPCTTLHPPAPPCSSVHCPAGTRATSAPSPHPSCIMIVLFPLAQGGGAPALCPPTLMVLPLFDTILSSTFGTAAVLFFAPPFRSFTPLVTVLHFTRCLVCLPLPPGEGVKGYNDLAHFETAYVVKLHSAARLTEPKEVFTFTHPNRQEPIDNTRYKRLLFDLPPDTGSALVHGFGGYFDAVLYGDVHLGIEPSTATPSMFSWFPIFFPLRFPVYVPAGEKLEVHFWRCVGPTKVWYEWAVTAPSMSPVHNPNGRSYWRSGEKHRNRNPFPRPSSTLPENSNLRLRRCCAFPRPLLVGRIVRHHLNEHQRVQILRRAQVQVLRAPYSPPMRGKRARIFLRFPPGCIQRLPHGCSVQADKRGMRAKHSRVVRLDHTVTPVIRAGFPAFLTSTDGISGGSGGGGGGGLGATGDVARDHVPRSIRAGDHVMHADPRGFNQHAILAFLDANGMNVLDDEEQDRDDGSYGYCCRSGCDGVTSETSVMVKHCQHHVALSESRVKRFCDEVDYRLRIANRVTTLTFLEVSRFSRIRAPLF
ncbi:unnamed protein product [Closterium sp. NIES-53]